VEKKTFTQHIPPSLVLSPSDVLELVASSRDCLVVKVKGYVLKENGYVYLTDDKKYKVTLDSFPSDVPEGTVVEVEGILKCYTHPNGGIYPRIRVRNFSVVEDKNLSTAALEEKLLDILRRKNKNYSFLSYIERVLLDKKQQGKELKLNVAVIHGLKAQTHLDFEQGINETIGIYRKHVSLKYHEIPLSNDKKLAERIKTIAEQDKPDIIFIVRGGGDKRDLENIGGPETCFTVAEIDTPVFLAIGHTLDRGISTLELVSSGRFSTPNAAGIELGKTVNLICDRIFQPKYYSYAQTTTKDSTFSIALTVGLILLVLFVILLLFTSK